MSTWPGIDEIEVDLDFGTDGEMRLGRLTEIQGRPQFEYDPAILQTPVNPSPITLERTTEKQDGYDSFDGLHPIFSDSQPDGWTRHLVDRRVREAGYNPRDLGILDRLALVGGNGVGALSYSPAAGLGVELRRLTVDDLAEIITRVDGGTKEEIALAERMAGSLGGVRPKSHISSDGVDMSITPRPDRPGYTPWIMKFPSPAYDDADAGVVEYAYSNMARAAGIEMPRTKLYESLKGPGFFAAERFDYDAGRRFHYQSYGGMVGIAPLTGSDYSDLIRVGRQLVDNPEEQLIRRMAFNVLAANRDDHVRNHGFLMDSCGSWRLAPAFDLTFSPQTGHAMAVGGLHTKPRLFNMRKAVRDAGADDGGVARLVKEVRDVVREWPTFAKDAGVPPKRAEAIMDEIVRSDPPDPRGMQLGLSR